MIQPDMIPDEVVEAASREYELYIYDAVSADGIRLAIAAALNAWPGNIHYRGGWEPVIHNNRKPHLILPLTENGNG